MPFLSSKKKDDFDRVKAWEYQEGWNNPFGDDEYDEYDDVDDVIHNVDDDVLEVGTVRGERAVHVIDAEEAHHDTNKGDRKSRKKKKSKRSRKKKHISDEESSQADSLLSEILDETEGVEEMEVDRMVTLEEELHEDSGNDGEDEEDDDDDDDDNDSMLVVASMTREKKKSPYGTSARYNRIGGPAYGKAVSKTNSPRSRYAQRGNQIVDSSDEEEEAQDDSIMVDHVDTSYTLGHGSTAAEADSMKVQANEDDESTIEDAYNPFDGMKALLKTSENQQLSNPFGDDSDEDGEDESEFSSLMPPPSKHESKTQNPFDNDENQDEENDEDEEVASDDDANFLSKMSSEELSDDEEEEDKKTTPESDEEDIVESSKRLLRMADQRIQYQQHSDEVHVLKSTIEDMEGKAEAMAEQLRRAVETKCDLVLAQNEMERCHEQDLIAKDDEIKDLRRYVQELMDAQARSELNLMNEISSLARRLEQVTAKHEKEIEDKDEQIADLERKVQNMKTGSVRSKSSREAFKSRFADVENRSVGSTSASSKKSLFI